MNNTVDGHRSRGATGAFLLITALLAATPAAAQPNPSPSAATSAEPSTSAEPTTAPVPSDETLTAVLTKTAQIEALLTEQLDVTVEPASLFAVPLGDPAAVHVEARRLKSWLETHYPEALEADDDPTDPDDPTGPTEKPATSSQPAVEPPAGEPATDDDLAVDPSDTLWRARLALDASTYRFLASPASERDRLLAAHQTRQREANADADANDDAERRASEADAARTRALEQAKRARSEAERLVAEELARLLAVEKAQADLEASLQDRREQLEARREEALRWRRRIAEALAATPVDAVHADELYAELRRYLQATRAELGAAMAAPELPTDVPSAGADPLADLGAEVDTNAVAAQREKVGVQHRALLAAIRKLDAERTAQLMAETEALNRLRLDLLDHISANKRDAVTSFAPAGLDQASSEARQVLLTARFHLRQATRWLGNLRDPGATREASAWFGTWLAIKWGALLAAVWWWRRRAAGTLEALRDKVRTDDRHAGHSLGPSLADRGLSFLIRVRAPLELLVACWLAWLLLPETARTVLEVQLVATIVSWTLGGALVIQSVDALASEEVLGARAATTDTETDVAALRLRSLRLVGRAIIVFGLILSLSATLVGEGTIYSWVWSTCWFAAIPVFFVIIRWWQPVIFERVQAVRKKGWFEGWVVSKERGLMSFVAAAAGGIVIFGRGAVRIVRSRVLTFDATRRALAYLFRRGLSKRAQNAEHAADQPLPEELFVALGPETSSSEIVPSVADEDLADVAKRIRAAGGGVFAVVGERGSGKSTMLGRLAAESKHILRVACPPGGLDALDEAILHALGREDASLEDAIADFDAVDALDTALLIDDAHHLILPMMGGLDAFDRVLSLARQRSERCTWIFAIDEVLWRFFERARGAEPLFDDVIRLAPWSEEGIVGLLTKRTEEAGIDPSFTHLLEDLPPDADEIDREEALARTEASYYRLLWDYAGGNPGVALHFWRSCLVVDDEAQVHVRVFDGPAAEALEGLPDEAVFVLRAVVQLGWATEDAVQRTTSLGLPDVQNALRYGSAKGWFERSDARYHITWNWFRAITRFLRRRHLLSAA